MATKGSLLAHLCLQFATHPENLAVEALGYLLKESEDTRSSFVGLLRARGIDLPDSLRFSTQVTGKDATRPDLVGKDRVGREVVLIEAKFWAVRGQIGRSVPSVPARVVMELLGHSQISLTMNTYSHVMPELRREAADRMDAALTGRA